jgi:DNA helicase IV
VYFAGVEETADELLLRELGRRRTGTLRDIVATIQIRRWRFRDRFRSA